MKNTLTDFNTIVNPIDILLMRINELEQENIILCNQYNALRKQNVELQTELNNYTRID